MLWDSNTGSGERQLAVIGNALDHTAFRQALKLVEEAIGPKMSKALKTSNYETNKSDSMATEEMRHSLMQ